MSYIERNGKWYSLNQDAGIATLMRVSADRSAIPTGWTFLDANYWSTAQERRGSLNPGDFATKPTGDTVLGLCSSAVREYEKRLSSQHVPIQISINDEPPSQYIVVDGVRHTQEGSEGRTFERLISFVGASAESVQNAGLLALQISVAEQSTDGMKNWNQSLIDTLVSAGVLPKIS